MPTVAAPVILQEMEDWVSLGGGNSGIVGDPNHDYGFHIGARYLPSSDYSRRRDPNGSNGPYVNWDYACAGDFSHKNQEKLRKHHRRVLKGLMAGKYPMICEFIGKPWADRPVYYWARWNGIKTLQRYTGFGHDHWSHITWYRSKVDQRAFLWIVGEEDMAISKDDANKVFKYDGSIDAPSLTAMGNERTGIKDNPEWSANTVLQAIYNNVARVRGEQAAALAKAAGERAAILELIRQVASSAGTTLTDAQVERLATAVREAGDGPAQQILDRLQIAGQGLTGE